MNTALKLAAAALTTALAGLVAAPAGWAQTDDSQRFTLLFRTQNGVDKPAVAIATGPITGVGTETQTEDEYPDHQISYAVLHLPRGDVSITFAETFSWVPDFRACLAHGTGSGTFAITGGTGAYRGATGSGTFTDTGPLLGPRDQHGRWLGPDSGVLPRLVTVRVDAVGTTSTSG